MPWTCFLIEPTGTARRYLRRYASGSSCPAGEHRYHNAMTPLDEVPIIFDADGKHWWIERESWSHDSPLWPAACECGYVFSDDDTWQLFDQRLYRRVDTGELCTLQDAPIGAVWESDWLTSMGRGPDDRCLSVMTPGGQWNIDLPSSSGPGWTRSGEAPRITARPSIHVIGRYHGWLTDGVLSDDLDGRSY